MIARIYTLVGMLLFASMLLACATIGTQRFRFYDSHTETVLNDACVCITVRHMFAKPKRYWGRSDSSGMIDSGFYTGDWMTIQVAKKGYIPRIQHFGKDDGSTRAIALIPFHGDWPLDSSAYGGQNIDREKTSSAMYSWYLQYKKENGNGELTQSGWGEVLEWLNETGFYEYGLSYYNKHGTLVNDAY